MKIHHIIIEIFSSPLGRWQRLIIVCLAISVMHSLFLIGAFAADRWYVVPYYLNVRSEGRYNSQIMATLSRGSKVTVIASTKNGWKKIELENGMIGYVNGRYLSSKEPLLNITQGEILKVSVSNAFMRDNSLRKKVAVLNRGDSLEVISDGFYREKWIQAKILDSQSGKYNSQVAYISKDLVEKFHTIEVHAQTINQESDNWLEDFSVAHLI